MKDASFFLHPSSQWQRRYEALRALFVERLPAPIVALRFGFSPGYLRLLKHLFTHGKIDFSEPIPEGATARRRVSSQVRSMIRQWRTQRLSAGEIAQLLSDHDIDLSVRTVERVLAEEGFPRLPRRTGIKLGITVKGAQIPPPSQLLLLSDLHGRRLESSGAGIFVFAPFLAQLGISQIVSEAHLPGSATIPATNYLLSFLALKLLGTERYAHVGDHAFDPVVGLFAGLSSLPKCTAMSTYSYGLDDLHIRRLQQAFVRHAAMRGLYDGSLINLDFHAVPHYGDQSVLETHWAGARGKTMKSVLTLFAQDAQTKLMLYTDADIHRDEADDQVLQFLAFWRRVRRGVTPTLVFDSRFTSYAKLSELNRQGVRFITLRRRGQRLLHHVPQLSPWTRIHVPHAKRKFPHPEVHESTVTLRGYDGPLRQLIVRGNGHEQPAFFITNDFESPPDLVVGNYARRWRIENGLAEAVKFFHLNALSSPILTKVHFDVALTMMADTLYTMLAQKLRGFEECDAPTLHRHFIKGHASVTIRNSTVTVTFPRRAHNPILRQVAWHHLPDQLPALEGTTLVLKFR